MQYTNQNKLRRLILNPDEFRANDGSVVYLNFDLSAAIVDLKQIHKDRRLTTTPGFADGAEIAKHHAEIIEELLDELEALVSLLPEYFAYILRDRDISKIWPDENDLRLDNNPLHTRYIEISELLRDCKRDYNCLKDIYKASRTLALKKAELLLLSEDENSPDGLADHENIWATLRSRLPDEYKNHPAVIWAVSQPGDSAITGVLPGIRKKRDSVKKILKHFADAFELDQAFGTSNGNVLHQGHPLSEAYNAYTEFHAAHPRLGWIDWADTLFQSLALKEDPDNETNWKSLIRLGAYESGDTYIKVYLKREKDLIQEILHAQNKCNTSLEHIGQQGLVQLTGNNGNQPLTTPPKNRNRQQCSESTPMPLEYETCIQKAEYAKALAIFRRWFGETQSSSSDTEEDDFSRLVKERQHFIDQFNTWAQVAQYCQNGTKTSSIRIVFDAPGQAMGTLDSDRETSSIGIVFNAPDSLWGFCKEMVSNLTVQRVKKSEDKEEVVLEEIPKPKTGMPGASRWRREKYAELEYYRAIVLNRIRCARFVLDDLFEKKLQWDQACQEVDTQGRQWREKMKIPRWKRKLMRIDPQKDYVILQQKICKCCEIAPKCDTYRKLYYVNCDPESGLCQNTRR